jgi:AraC family transcriptional regulator
MSTGVGRSNVGGDQSLGCCTTQQAPRLASIPAASSASLPGIATVALYRSLPAQDRHGDKLSVGLHLGPPGWLEWRAAEQSARRVPVQFGSLSLMPEGMSFWWRRDQPSEFLLAALEPSFVAAVLGNGEQIAVCLRPVFQDPAISYILAALWAEACDGCPSGPRYGTSLCTALVIHLARRYAIPEVAAGVRKGGLSPARLRRVLDHIDGHLGDGIGLTQLAALTGLSPDHFAAQFRRSTGLPPHRYLLRRRIGRAKELVSAGRMPLAEISYVLGFPSQAHFTTMFRKLVGTTPGAYRNGFSHFGSGIPQESRNPPPNCERPRSATAVNLARSGVRAYAAPAEA